MDSDARLTDLYRRYRGEVFAFLFSRASSPDDAEDLVQETFLKAWQALSQVETDSGVLSWLRVIAYNVRRDFYRYQYRHAPISAWFSSEGQTRSVSVDPYPSVRQAILDDLLAALDTLTPAQREVLLLAADGLDVPATAQRMGSTPGAIRVLRWRARRAAQSALRERGFWD